MLKPAFGVLPPVFAGVAMALSSLQPRPAVIALTARTVTDRGSEIQSSQGLHRRGSGAFANMKAIVKARLCSLPHRRQQYVSLNSLQWHRLRSSLLSCAERPL